MTDQRIERVARAICRARGEDPDEYVLVDRGVDWCAHEPRWENVAYKIAVPVIAAFDELRAIEAEQGAGK